MADENNLEHGDDFGSAFEADDFVADDAQDAEAPAQPAHGDDDEFNSPSNEGPNDAADEGAPAGDEPAAPQQPAGDDVEALKKKAHGYDSMLGRLNKERAEREALEQRLAQLESAQRQPDQPASAPAEIPDEIKDDFAALSKENPQVAALLKEDTPEGKRLRSALAEYGREYVEDKAEVILTRRNLEAEIATVKSHHQLSVAEQARQQFFGAIGEKHPDFVGVIGTPEHAPYMAKVNEWAEAKPYKEAAKLFDVIERGNPQQIVALLDQFKAETSANGEQPAAPTPARRDPRAAAAAAVPSRPTPMPRAAIPKDSFDAGWDIETK